MKVRTRRVRPDGSESVRELEIDEPFYRLVADSIPHIVFVTTPDGATEYLNQQGVDYSGRPAGAVVRGWEWLSLVHPDDVGSVRETWHACMRSGDRYRLDFRIRRFDGEFRWHAFRAQPVRDPAGTIVKWIGTATDIDDAIQDTRLLATLQEMAPVGIGFVDRDYRYRRVNRRLAEMNGASIEEHLGRTVAEVVPQLWRQTEPAYAAVLAGESIIDQPMRGRAVADGDRVHDWLASMYPVAIQDAVVGIGVIVADITKRREAELAHRALLTDAIAAIAATVEARDAYTAGHQRRVAEISAAIAGEIGMGSDAIEGITLAATIHDIGKVAIPSEILTRPGRLRPAEWLLMQSHCQEGYDILQPIDFPWPVAEMVLQHHERLDGTGYPQRLRGDEIDYGARIIAVADVVEAMASHRPYRPARGIDAALAEIEKGRGHLFEPAVVDACLCLFADGRLQLD